MQIVLSRLFYKYASWYGTISSGKFLITMKHPSLEK